MSKRRSINIYQEEMRKKSIVRKYCMKNWVKKKINKKINMNRLIMKIIWRSWKLRCWKILIRREKRRRIVYSSLLKLLFKYFCVLFSYVFYLEWWWIEQRLSIVSNLLLLWSKLTTCQLLRVSGWSISSLSMSWIICLLLLIERLIPVSLCFCLKYCPFLSTGVILSSWNK